MLAGKKILVGITGGIAAYKICELVRLLRKEDADVRVIMTPSAIKFVSPLTLSVLSGNEVMINMFPEEKDYASGNILLSTQHIYTGRWADIVIIAPASANTIAKISYGFADNLLTSTLLASRCPVIIAPSMDEDMYLNEMTQSNILKLKQTGYHILEPEAGELASGFSGLGRLPEPIKILEFIKEVSKSAKKDLANKKVLVTAGPTYEPIDDVRFIGNYSTGKMGFEIARAAINRGAEVTLITGPSHLSTPRFVERIDVNTADEMFAAVDSRKIDADVIIMAAAVSDYKPVSKYKGKMKKENIGSLTLETEKTNDILKYLGEKKNGYKLIGFSLETENEIENSRKKLKEKNLDMIIINNPNTEGAGFGHDTNVVTIMKSDMSVTHLNKLHKFEIANKILDLINY